MEKVLYFNICAIPIYLIIIVTTIYRRMTVGRANLLYLGVAASALIACLAAFITELIEELAPSGVPLDDTSLIWIVVLEYVYFAARSAISLVYLLFVISMTKSWYKISHPLKKLIIYCPYLVLIGMMAVNEKFGWVFKVTAEGGYERGSKIFIVYIISFFYMAFGTFHLLLHRRSLDNITWISLMSMYFINLFTVVFQYFYPKYVIESFMTSLTVLFIVIYVQRPEKQVDANTGLPCYRAFCDEMNKIKHSGQGTQLMIISFINASELSKYLKESYLTYLHLIDNEVRLFAKKERKVCELYFESPGTFYMIIDDRNYNPVQGIPEVRDRIRKASADILEMGAQPDTRIVTLSFPEEISSLDELFRFGHSFSRFADYSRVFCRAETITGMRNYQIEAHLDDILNRAVASGGLKVKYQPLWSEKEKRFDSAEAVIELSDEIYGKIDSELLINAAEERGLIVSLGTRVMEEVFAFAGSDARRKLGYSRIYLGLSVTQCMQPELTDTVWNLREKYRVSPSHIAFEIKESSYENMSSAFNENLKKLSAQGYTIVLDGFGRGYSNMQNILDMPLKAVRLDRSIVRSGGTGSGKAVLQGLIDMLRNIPLEVIACGADDKETAKLLLSMGCQTLQGHHYADPADKDELIKRIN